MPQFTKVKPQSPVVFRSSRDHIATMSVGGADWSEGLVSLAEDLDIWMPSMRSNGKKGNVYDKGRTSEHVYLSDKAIFRKHTDRLNVMALSALASYGNHYPYSVHDGRWRRVVTKHTGFDLIRYKRGQKFIEHVDTGPHRQDEHVKSRVLSLVTFPSYDDSKLEGGELVFRNPVSRYVIRPHTGLVVMFPSGWTHPHQSASVRAGVKYSVVTWFV